MIILFVVLIVFVLFFRRPPTKVTCVYTYYSKSGKRFIGFEKAHLIYSVRNWKAFHTGEIIFYCDKKTAEYLKADGINTLFDRIDISSIDDVINNNPDINTKVFYNIAKFAVLKKEKAPLILVDTDLSVTKNISGLFNVFKVFCTNLESCKNDFYPDIKKLSTPPGYIYPAEVNPDLPACNTSIMAFGNDSLKQIYVSEAFKFMKGNPVINPSYGNPELLFVEQRLLPMVLKARCGENVYPLIEPIWDPEAGCFHPTSNKSIKFWAYDDLTNESQITHTWISKSLIKKNPKFETWFICWIIADMRQKFPDCSALIEKQSDLAPYCDLLEKYGSVEALVRAGIASNHLA